ncbi:MAG: cytochrome-c peroxidase [Myxococcaceae bacterium]|nr:cytochrome-c peroxidase [Myxococcaceae bacterium]
MSARVCSALVAFWLAGCGPLESSWTAPRGNSVSAAEHHRTAEVTGGTLISAGGGRFAVVTDADLDRVWVVDLAQGSIRNKVQLPSGSAPGRLVEDAHGAVWVALRGTGQLAKVSPSSGTVGATIDVCPEPRGLSLASNGDVLVACSSGEFARVSTAGVAVQQVGLELRDVLETPAGLTGVTFRTAQVVSLGSDGAVTRTVAPPTVGLPPAQGVQAAMVPKVAWRAVAAPGGRVVIAHQRHVEGPIAAIQLPAAPPSPAYYGNTCSSAVVRSALTVIGADGVAGSIELGGALPVDLAISPDGEQVAVAIAGTGAVAVLPLSSVAGVSGGVCGARNPFPFRGDDALVDAVAYTPQGRLLVHSREPNRVEILPPSGSGEAPTRILLNEATPKDPGALLFHTAPSGSSSGVPIACASCHPEAREDGHAWTFFSTPMRTQTVAGDVTATAPFHWKGTLNTLDALLGDTFVTRMGREHPDAATVKALSEWLARIPEPRVARADDALVARGDVLFHQAEVGCAGCHSGQSLTNNQTLDVGTGGSFQVPSLRGVAGRGPWMHDGCATTLRERFTRTDCGGTAHGNVDGLGPGDLDALLAYLTTL